MKKTLIGLFASIALVLGVGAIGSSATAAYPSTVSTNTLIIRDAGTTEGKAFNVQIAVLAGNVVVTDGNVTIVFGGVKFSTPIVNGYAAVNITAPQVKKNRFKTVKAYYRPLPGSVFKSSNAVSKIYVRNS